MRKRRRLANKMTIMVCAVLLAVSTFFYAPMEVNASSTNVLTSKTFNQSIYCYSNNKNYGFNVSDESFVNSPLESDSYYKVDFNYSYSLDSSVPFMFKYCYLTYNWKPIMQIYAGRTDSVLQDSVVSGHSFIEKGSVLNFLNTFGFMNTIILDSDALINFTFDYDITAITPLTGEESETYLNGYNAGYSAGEQAGYGNGYSNGFADGEASVDIDAIYDEAFQAGKDSVDTQSYYDAGYQAGYQVSYSEGYESGYDEGYQNAMDRIANWGADTSDYPKQIYSFDMGHTFSTNVTYSVPFLYRDSIKGYLSNVQLNPNHTYRFDVEIYPHDWDSADTITYENEFYFCIGGIDYPLSYFSNESTLTSLFVPGDRMSDSCYLVWSTIRASVDGTNNICRVVCPYTITLYDMGPSGDTQNHIANQTDQLTNGYDDSKGNTVNSELSTGLNEYETAENSLFATATTGMKDFTFFDFESVPAMITGMSFIGSIMGSWFNQAGGASGVGIVLSILFSVILVAMVLGLYRWYQSRGGKN